MKILNFLSLLSSDDKLSLTSVGIYIVLFKIAVASNPGFGDVGALLLVLLNYAHKRYMTAQVEEAVVPTDDMARTLEELRSKVNALSIKVGFK